MKPDYAEAILERDWIERGFCRWIKDTPSGRFFVEYDFGADKWRASFRGFSDCFHRISHLSDTIHDAIKWAERVEEDMSHEGD